MRIKNETRSIIIFRIVILFLYKAIKPFSGIILISIFILNVCSREKITTYYGVADSNNTLKNLRVFYDIYDDSEFGGSNAIAMNLTIENNSSEKIENCILIINNRYKANLESLEYYYGFLKGNQPFGRDYIKPNESIKFSFSHDNNNHIIFQDNEKNVLLRRDKIDTLKVICKGREGIWIFK
jgi:hypothetical protein